jgi:hypothetical protein
MYLPTAITSVLLLASGLANASPLHGTDIRSTNELPRDVEYRYFTNGRELERGNSSGVPVKFNKKPIGTTELPATAPSGTVHALSDGHHFRHKGWYLTDTNGGSWEYLPELSKNKTSPIKRDADVTRLPSLFYEFMFNTDPFTQGSLSGASGTNSPFILSQAGSGAAGDFIWAWGNPGLNHIVDLAIEESDGLLDLVAGSTVIGGDLEDIWFNAVDIFF